MTLIKLLSSQARSINRSATRRNELRLIFHRDYHALQAAMPQSSHAWQCYKFHTGSIRWKTRAVIFDMGGVVLPSPFPLTRAYEDERGIPAGTIWKTIDKYGQDGAWPKLEVGLLDSFEFGMVFTEECSAVAGEAVELYDFLEYLEKGMGDPIPKVLDAIKAIQAEGIKTALLTNNWKNGDGSTLLPFDKSIFDVVIESAVVGVNKPNPVIYKRCLNDLGVRAEDAVFLDDIGTNLKAARSLGIHSVKVENITDALNDLEKILGFPLRGYVGGTKAIRKGMEINQNQLIKYIQDTLKITSNDPPNIRQFSHGQSNPTYYVEYGNLKAVLRKKPPGKLLPSAHAVEREYRVMSAMADAGVPIPPLLSLCEDSSIIGTPFYLMEYVQGSIFKNPLLPGMEPEKRRRIWHQLIDVLCQIHSVDLEKANLADFGKKGNFIERQVTTWTRQYRSSETQTIPAMDRIIEWLPHHIPKVHKNTIVHCDYRLDNVIFDPETDKILGVLDWELSTTGDPLVDLSYLCLAHHLPKNFPILPGLLGIDIGKFGICDVPEIMARYCETMGIQSVDNLDFYFAFNLFRVAAILQGVHKRYQQGQASSASASAAGKLAVSMAEKGWEFATKEGFRVFNDTNRTRLNDPASTNSHTHNRKFSTCVPKRWTHHADGGNGMLAISSEVLRPEVQKMLEEVRSFINNKILPIEHEFRQRAESTDPQTKWTVHPQIEVMKGEAKRKGLWNLFIPTETDPEQKYGAGLTNVEYAYLCEEMGRCLYSSEIFNCSAPDTGNMEVLIKYGSEEQKEKWLKPLLDGKIRSCFAMTEPNVASSDATNIESSIRPDGDKWVINGRKWWTSCALDKRTKFAIFMGKTDPTASKHRQQSMVIVPMDTEGVTVVRPLTVFGFDDAPVGHGEVLFENVRVPRENMIREPGSGFEIAQGRLGPGRIHHCMRLIGHAERSLELMKQRVKSRVAFGKVLADQGIIQQHIAQSRMEIEQARLLVLKTAHLMDTVGNKVAAPEIAMIKVIVPNMASRVIDRAIQAHGAGGLSGDYPLAGFYMWARALRLADGPDEVHMRAVARMELSEKR